PHGRVPRCRARAARPLARGHRAHREQLHLVHALRARVPRLVHPHRLAQGGGPSGDGGWPVPAAQRPRPLCHRLVAVHVLRHLRRGLPLRRTLLEPAVRVRRDRHPRPPPREGAPRAVGRRRPRAPRARPGRGGPARGDRGEQAGTRSGRTVGRAPMTGLDIAFAAIGLVTAAAGAIAVTSRQVVHSALWLVVALLGLAGCYLVLGAELVALVQVLVYVGAIVVLVIVALMLTRAPIGPRRAHSTSRAHPVLAALVRPRPPALA